MITATKQHTIKAVLSYEAWIKQYIFLWNGMLQLTTAEIDLLYTLIIKYFELKKVISSDNEVFELLFSTRKRKEIKTELNISEQVFNNRFVALKKKGIIKTVNNSYKLDNKILPLQELTFKFEIK